MSKISNVPQIRFKGFTDDWEQRRLGEFGISTGGTSIESEFVDDGDYKVISIGSYSETSQYTDQGLRVNKTSKTSSRILNKNDLTMILNDKTSSGKIIGRVLIINEDDSYVYNQRTQRIEVNKDYFSPIFLYQYLNADNIRSKIIRAAQGNTQIYVNWTTISEIEYTIPINKREQEKIANYCKSLDTLITLHQRKYEYVVNFKKAMLEKMFPKDGSDIPEIRFKEFSGQKSDSWEAAKMSEIASVIDPHPSHRAPDVVYSGIPFIGIGDVDETGEIDCSSARTVHERIFEEHKKRYDLSIPSIGIGRVASLGKVIRLRNDIGKYAVSPTMAIIQFSRNVDNNYMYSFMCTASFQKQFSSQGNGSTRQSVGIQDLRELMVLLPKKNREQETIGMYFNCLDNLCILYQRKLQQLKKIKKAMLEKMFV